MIRVRRQHGRALDAREHERGGKNPQCIETAYEHRGDEGGAASGGATGYLAALLRRATSTGHGE